jgi:hypothetical protein
VEAAAIKARLPMRVGAEPRALSCGLEFSSTPGPLVAVCGLVGGSGASTLALALARQAAAESGVPILLTEPDSYRAGLAAMIGRSGGVGLAALAREVHDGNPPRHPFVEIEPRLRLVASSPGRDEPAPDEAIGGVLAHARDAHGLVVVDCGTSWAAAPGVLDYATHVLWTVRATAPGVAAAAAVLESLLPPAAGRSREALVATAAARRGGVNVRSLRRLAQLRCERLILSPFEESLGRGDESDPAAIASALTGLASFLGRS